MNEFSIRNMIVTMPLRGIKRQHIKRMEERVAYAVTMDNTLHSSDHINIPLRHGIENPLIQCLLGMDGMDVDGDRDLTLLETILIVFKADLWVQEKDGTSHARAGWKDINEIVQKYRKDELVAYNDTLFQLLTWLMEKNWYEFYLERGEVPSVLYSDDLTSKQLPSVNIFEKPKYSSKIGTHQENLPEFEYVASVTMFGYHVDLGPYSSVNEALHVQDMYAICNQTLALMVYRYYYACLRCEIESSNSNWLEARDNDISIDEINNFIEIGHNSKQAKIANFLSDILPSLKDSLLPQLNFCKKWHKIDNFSKCIDENTRRFHDQIDHLIFNLEPHIELSNILTHIIDGVSDDDMNLICEDIDSNTDHSQIISSEVCIENRIMNRELEIEKKLTFIEKQAVNMSRLMFLEKQNVISLIADYEKAEGRHAAMYQLVTKIGKSVPTSIISPSKEIIYFDQTSKNKSTIENGSPRSSYILEDIDQYYHGIILDSQVFFV